MWLSLHLEPPSGAKDGRVPCSDLVQRLQGAEEEWGGRVMAEAALMWAPRAGQRSAQRIRAVPGRACAKAEGLGTARREAG